MQFPTISPTKGIEHKEARLPFFKIIVYLTGVFRNQAGEFILIGIRMGVIFSKDFIVLDVGTAELILAGSEKRNNKKEDEVAEFHGYDNVAPKPARRWRV